MEKENFFEKIESEKRIITISDLIDKKRAIPGEYQKLIQKQKEYGGNYSTSHSLSWEDWAEEDEAPFLRQDIAFLKQHLLGSTLIDLGAGQAKIIEKLCKKIGVKTYARVDPFIQLQTPRDLEVVDITFDEIDLDTLHIINAKSDMLKFTTLMHSNSGNFVLNGMDDYVIKSEEYKLALSEELARTTQPNGIIFGLNSEAIEYNLKGIADQKNSLLSKLDLSSFRFPPGAFIYVKK